MLGYPLVDFNSRDLFLRSTVRIEIEDMPGSWGAVALPPFSSSLLSSATQEILWNQVKKVKLRLAFDPRKAKHLRGFRVSLFGASVGL